MEFSTEIYLNTKPWLLEGSSVLVAKFARHRLWEEERYVEMFKDALLCILERVYYPLLECFSADIP